MKKEEITEYDTLPTPEEKFESIGPTIKCLHHTIKRRMTMDELANGADEVTVMNGWIIKYIYRNQDRDLFQKDLEAHFSMARSSISSILSDLEKNGYLVRESVKRDARLKRIVLTEKGVALHLRRNAHFKKEEELMRQGISEEELDCFFSVISKIKQNLEIDGTCGIEHCGKM